MIIIENERKCEENENKRKNIKIELEQNEIKKKHI